jgi:hypothetical protein
MNNPEAVTAVFQDITAPTSVAIDSPSGTATRVGGTVTLRVEGCDSGSGLDKAEFRVNGGLVGTDTSETPGSIFLPCSISPDSYSISWNSLTLFPSNGGSTADDGTATIQIKVFDLAGNITTVTRTIVIDNTAPLVAITEGPANGSVTSNRDAAFTFIVSESGTTMACRLDAAAFGACNTATTHVVSGLADGVHTFEVRSTDPAGNTTTVSRTWTVAQPAPPPPVAAADTTAPAVTLGIKAGQKLLASLRKGLRATAGCSEACALQAKLLIAQKLAKRLKLPTVVGKATANLAAGGSTNLVVKFTARAKRKLAKLRSVRVTLVVIATDAATNAATARKAATLRR